MSFVTTVYRKPNFSGMYTHLDSFLPTLFKFGMIYTIAYQYFKICSDWKKIHKELHFLKRAFSKNVYPLLFIDKYSKTVINKLVIKRAQIIKVKKKTYFCHYHT